MGRRNRAIATPPAVKQKVRRLRRAGERIGTIAQTVGLHRNTVAKIVRGLDDAYFAEEWAIGEGLEIDVIKGLQTMVRRVKCPHCTTDFLILASQYQIRCADCHRTFFMRAVE